MRTGDRAAASLGRSSLAGYITDSWRQLRRPLVPTLVALVVVFTGTLAIFATTGQSMASQQRTLERLNSPEGRLVTISDGSGAAGLRPSSVDALVTLDGVEWVVGVSSVTDVTNGADRVGEVVPSRRFYGSWPPAVALRTTRDPVPGDAVVPERLRIALSMEEPVGSLRGRHTNAIVVGSFRAQAPLTTLEDEVLIVGNIDDDAPLLHLHLSVDDVVRLPDVTQVALDTVHAQAPGALTMSTSDELAVLTSDITTELAVQARWTLAGLLSAVTVLVAALQYGRVASLSRDIGRRRALGASRSLIVAQVLTNALLTGLLGALLGASVGVGLILGLVGAPPGLDFTVAVVALITLAAVAAAVLPGVRAARLDPVRILRVP